MFKKKIFMIENIIILHIVLIAFLILFITFNLVSGNLNKLNIFILIVLCILLFFELLFLVLKAKKMKYNHTVRNLYKYRLKSYFFRIESTDLMIQFTNYDQAIHDYNLLSFFENMFNSDIKKMVNNEIIALRNNPGKERQFSIRFDDQENLTCNWYDVSLVPFVFNNELNEIIVILDDVTSEKQYRVNVEVLEKTQNENKELITTLEYQVSGYDFIRIFFDNAFSIFTENNSYLTNRQDGLFDLRKKVEEKDKIANETIVNIKQIQNRQKEILTTLYQSFQNIIESFKNLNKNTNTITEICNSLESRIEELNEILNLILSITDKTKTLSINASIESAHAGKSGVGFKIIANEIKKLSENTEKNTNSIQVEFEQFNKEISAILKADKEIVASLESTSDKIEDYIVHLKTGNDEIDGASRSIDSVTRIFKEIITDNLEFIHSFDELFNDLLKKNNTIIEEMTEAKKQIDNVKVQESKEMSVMLFNTNGDENKNKVSGNIDSGIEIF